MGNKKVEKKKKKKKGELPSRLMDAIFKVYWFDDESLAKIHNVSWVVYWFGLLVESQIRKINEILKFGHNPNITSRAPREYLSTDTSILNEQRKVERPCSITGQQSIRY